MSPATGDVYVAEGYQGRVLRFSPAGALLGSVGAGTGLGQVTNPTGVAMRPGTGRVYVAENAPTRTLQSFDAALGSPADESAASAFGDGSQIAFDAAGANLWTLPSGNGLAKFSVADLSSPAVTTCPERLGRRSVPARGYVGGLTVDADGRVWVPDRFNNRIQRFDANGANPVAYGGIGSDALGFVLPQGIVADGASLVVSDASGRIRRYDRATLALQSTVGGPGLAGLRSPALALSPDGSVLEQDSGASLVRRLGPDGSVLRTFGVAGTGPGQFYLPSALAADPAGNILQVDQLGRRLQKLTADGSLVWSKGPLDFSDPDRLLNANGVAAGPDGTVYVADSNARRVMIYSPSGAVTGSFGKDGTGDGEFRSPRGIVVDGGSVYVVDGERVDVQRFSATGVFQGRFGAPGGGTGQFVQPIGIAADARGAIYVLDAGASKVQVFGRDGSVRGAFGEAGPGPGQLDRPVAIAADTRAVVLSDTSGRVQRFVLPVPPAIDATLPPPVTDTAAPRVTLKIKRQRLRDVLRRGLKVTCATSERATCQVSLVIARKQAGRVKLKLRKGLKDLQLGRSTGVAATEKKAAALTVRPALKYRGALGRRSVRSVVLLVRATARDPAGNVGRRTLVVTLRR